MEITPQVIEDVFNEAAKGWSWEKCKKSPKPSGTKHRVREFWGKGLSVSSLSWIASSSCTVATKMCALGVGSNFHLGSNDFMYFGNLVHNSLMPRVAEVLEKRGIPVEVERRYSASLPTAPTVEIRGRVDGAIPNTVLLELKNRYPGNTQAGVKPYEALQASVYAITHKMPICLVVAQYNSSKPQFKAHWLTLADAKKRYDVIQSLVKQYARVSVQEPMPPVEGADCNQCPQNEQCGIPKAKMLCSHCQRPVTLDTLHLIPRGRSMPLGIHYCGYAYLVKGEGENAEISQIRVSGDRLQRIIN